MVKLRLSRIGKKGHSTFRIVVSDRQKDTVGTYLELLGTYDPHMTPSRIDLKADRVKYWLSVGAQPSDTVYNLLVEQGIVPGPKRKIVSAKPVEKAPEAAPVDETPVEAPVEAVPAEAPAA